MTRDRSFWFGRSFDAGTRRLEQEGAAVGKTAVSGSAHDQREPERAAPSTVEQARLDAKAEAFTAATVVARGYEGRGANAAAVRIALAYRSDEAWCRAEAHRHSLLETADADALSGVQDGHSLLPDASAVSSGETHGLTADGHVDPLDLREARIRLDLIPDALQAAINHLEAMREVPGNPLVMQTLKVIDHLRTIESFARGETRASLPVPVPEPQSIRVGPPKLTVVRGEPAA